MTRTATANETVHTSVTGTVSPSRRRHPTGDAAYELIERAHEGVESCERDPEHPPCGGPFGIYVGVVRQNLNRSECITALAGPSPTAVALGCEEAYALPPMPARIPPGARVLLVTERDTSTYYELKPVSITVSSDREIDAVVSALNRLEALHPSKWGPGGGLCPLPDVELQIRFVFYTSKRAAPLAIAQQNPACAFIDLTVSGREQTPLEDGSLAEIAEHVLRAKLTSTPPAPGGGTALVPPSR